MTKRKKKSRTNNDKTCQPFLHRCACVLYVCLYECAKKQVVSHSVAWLFGSTISAGFSFFLRLDINPFTNSSFFISPFLSTIHFPLSSVELLSPKQATIDFCNMRCTASSLETTPCQWPARINKQHTSTKRLLKIFGLRCSDTRRGVWRLNSLAGVASVNLALLWSHYDAHIVQRDWQL